MKLQVFDFIYGRISPNIHLERLKSKIIIQTKLYKGAEFEKRDE